MDIQADLFIILNLIVIESLLSVDNAAVLATMVMDLPKEQRAKALKYGIIGAYVFRGICLVLASYIIQLTWLKGLGGLYLLFLAFNYFRTKATPKKEDDLLNKKEKKFYQRISGKIGVFWSTVIMVEIMDMAFSIDNVFAAVAYTDKLYLIIIGVFIGILTMRFVAQGFVQIMERFPFLETSAFIVIGVLGIKLVASFACNMHWLGNLCHYIEGENADMYVSLLTLAIFFIPLLISLMFGGPKKRLKKN